MLKYWVTPAMLEFGRSGFERLCHVFFVFILQKNRIHWFHGWKQYREQQPRLWRGSCPLGNMVPWKFNLMAKVTRWCYCAHYLCACMTIAHALKGRCGVSLWDQGAEVVCLLPPCLTGPMQILGLSPPGTVHCLAGPDSQDGDHLNAIWATTAWSKSVNRTSYTQKNPFPVSLISSLWEIPTSHKRMLKKSRVFHDAQDDKEHNYPSLINWSTFWSIPQQNYPAASPKMPGLYPMILQKQRVLLHATGECFFLARLCSPFSVSPVHQFLMSGSWPEQLCWTEAWWEEHGPDSARCGSVPVISVIIFVILHTYRMLAL